jgi:hypothetical protein
MEAVEPEQQAVASKIADKSYILKSPQAYSRGRLAGFEDRNRRHHIGGVAEIGHGEASGYGCTRQLQG